MNSITNISKNIIAISVVSTLLLFSLCFYFWFNTLNQRGEAAQLQASTQPEETLFHLAHSLSEERRLIHSMLAGVYPSSEDMDQLYGSSLNSHRLIRTAVKQIRDSRESNSALIQHRYSEESVNTMLHDVTDGFDRISQFTSIVIQLTGSSPQNRDESIRMQLFDAYGDLINNVNNLRTKTQFLPDNYYRNVVATHSLKNAVWDIRESISQTSAMLDAYLIKKKNGSLKNINRDGLLFRTYQNIHSADNALLELKEFSGSNDLDNAIKTKLAELTMQFQTSYRPLEGIVIEALASGHHEKGMTGRWEQATTNINTSINSMITDTIDRTISSSQEIESFAIKTLIGGTLLLGICIAMAILSISTARKIQHQATHDDLTDLPNRLHFSTNIDRKYSDVSQPNTKFSLLTLDLNRFKIINDTMGHAVGDLLLKEVAERLKLCIEEDMAIARMGGDEFSILTNYNKSASHKLAQKIVEHIENPFNIENNQISIGASIGISFYPDDAKDADHLQITSDFAMFYAKSEGKNSGKSTIQAYNRDMAEKFEQRTQTEQDLAVAIENNQLELHYQPQVNLSANRANAVEALVRWNHPTRGMVPPFQFIEIAEECGLMPSLGNWVMEEACRQASQWNRETDLSLRVAINVSAHQIVQKGFATDVIETLSRHQLPPEFIEIEITESALMTDSASAIKTMLKLRDSGIKLAIDDFGTGYSSLSKLQDLPVDTLKIDRSFISKLDDESETSQSVTATISSIANTLGMETVAEGVESIAQLNKVADLGIDVVQGYFYSKPVPSADVPETIQNLNVYISTEQRAA